MEYIDITPKWAALMPVLLEVLKHGETEKAKQDVCKELQRMAVALDNYNDREKAKEENKLQGNDIEANIWKIDINNVSMYLPPNTGNYYGFIEDEHGRYTWFSCPAFIHNVPDTANWGIIEDEETDKEDLERIKEWVIMVDAMFKDTWDKGW